LRNVDQAVHTLDLADLPLKKKQQALPAMASPLIWGADKS